jgi:hypothetical protein
MAFLGRLARVSHRLAWWRRGADTVTHDDAVAELHKLEHTKAQLDRYDRNPNEGYHTPFNSSAYPNLDI